MRRRAPKPPINGHAVAHPHPANHCRALVLADGAEIRRKIKKDYEKALRDLNNSRRQLDQFHQKDQPEFTRWLHSHFGALLTEIRELGQKIAADEAFIFLVEGEVMFGGASHARAYQRVMAARDQPEPPPPTGGGGEPEAEQFGARPEFSDPEEDEDDPLNAFFDEVFGPGARPQDRRGRPAGQQHASAAPHAASRLKELYRALVRRLHPDSQREMTPQKTEWWHQAQTAYEAGDAEQLEVILTLCEIGDSGTTAHTSASLLQRITAQLKSSLRQFNRQLAKLRREPAWNFSRRADLELVAVRMRRDLTQELEQLREAWQETQELIASWKAAAERGRPTRRKKPRRQPQDMEFPLW